MRDSLIPALALIGIVLLIRIVYAIFLCPYDLVEDEAHYWLWAQHLDWSYYSKGPGIAWVIGLSTGLFGHAEWAVRLPTVIASAVGAFACAGLARDVARAAFVPTGAVAAPSRAAVLAAAAYFLAPAFQLTGILVTIDGCYLAAWAVACWAGWRAIAERSRSAWLVLGLALGIGFLFKYTILLLIPGLKVFAWRQRRAGGGRLWIPGLLLATALLLLCTVPVVYWNAREGWPTFRHLLGHLGLRGGDMPIAPSSGGWRYDPMWTVNYLLAPLGMIGPLLGVAFLAVRRILRPREAQPAAPLARRTGVVYLLCCFAPIFAFYLLVSLVAEPEQNWALAGFVTLMVLAGWFAADELARRRAGAAKPELTAPPRPRTRIVKVFWRLGLIYGLGAAIVLHRGDLIAAGLNRLAALPPVFRAIESIRGGPPRPIVTGRLIGAKRMASHVGRILDELSTGGMRPFVMAEHYGRASQMAFYLFRDGRGDVTVLSPQSVMGGRRSQFDFWTETALNQARLLGQPAVLLSNDKPTTIARWREMFAAVEPIDTPGHKLAGEHKKDRIAYVGSGYRGVPAAEQQSPR